eukprot:11323540-Ditylum_brightwellii.AAC.2
MDPSITQAAVLLSLYDPSLTAIALPFLIASTVYCPSSSFSTSDVAHVSSGPPSSSRSGRYADFGAVGGC